MKRLLICLLLVGVVGCGKSLQAQPKSKETKKAETSPPKEAANPWDTPTRLALFMAQKTKGSTKAVALSDIASALHKAGDKPQALAILKRAREAAQKIESRGFSGTQALSNIASAMVKAGDRKEALATLKQVMVSQKISDETQINKRFEEQFGLSEVKANAITGIASAMAKAGVLAMTRSLAVEWGPKGVRLNAIAPGPFPTLGAWERLVPTESLAGVFEACNPLGRTSERKELTNLVAYMLADQSRYMNGEVVTIDGGEWLAGAGQFSFASALSDEDWEEINPKKKK